MTASCAWSVQPASATSFDQPLDSLRRFPWVPKHVGFPDPNYQPPGVLELTGLALVPCDVVRNLVQPVVSVGALFQP